MTGASGAAGAGGRARRGSLRTRLGPSLTLTAGLYALWIVLSGKLDTLHLGAGALSAALVVGLSGDLARLGVRPGRNGRPVPVYTFSLPWGGYLSYLAWLLGQIVLANLQIAAVVLHPRLPVAPSVVRVRTRLEGDLARATYGNSITLTPGTITLDVEGDDLIVHALVPGAVRGLLSGEMERRIARAFRQA